MSQLDQYKSDEKDEKKKSSHHSVFVFGFLRGRWRVRVPSGRARGGQRGSLEGARCDPRSPRGPITIPDPPTFGPRGPWWGVRGVNPPSHLRRRKVISHLLEI